MTMKKINYLFGAILISSTITLFSFIKGDSEEESQLVNEFILDRSADKDDKNEGYLIRFQPDLGGYYDGSFQLVMTGRLMSMDMELGFWQEIVLVDSDQIESKMGFQSAKMNISMMGETVYYDSDNPYANEGSKEIHAQMVKSFSADLGIIMDSRGKVLKEYGWEDLSDDNQSNMMRGLTGMVYPEEPMNIGDSFDHKTEERGLLMDATYTLDNVSKSEYIFSVNGELKEGPSSGKVTGEIVVYRECGMTKSAILNMNMSTMGESIDMTVSFDTFKK